MTIGRRWVLFFVIAAAFSGFAYADMVSEWVALSSDTRESLIKTIKMEIEKRDSYCTPQEEADNLKSVDAEKAKEDAFYKNVIAAVTAEFNKSKKKRDDISAQFQAASTEFEEFQKNLETINATIANYDNQISRFEQDIKTQQESFKKWMKTEKQLETIVAVIYSKGLKDVAHDLEQQSDALSMPLMAERMGTYVNSFTEVVNNIVIVDFIKAVNEGTAKWTGEEPLRIELEKNSKGTVYLRIKRYELYPFQAPEMGTTKSKASFGKMKAAVISSVKDLESLLAQQGYSTNNYDLSRIDGLLSDTGQTSKLAEEAMREQAKAFQEKIESLQKKIKFAKSDKETQRAIQKNKLLQYDTMKGELDVLRKHKGETEKAFHEAQEQLHEKKRTHESIIVKTALAVPKGGQSAADATAESVVDKLEEVKNDAKIQHSSSTTTVVNNQVALESSGQAVTDAKIISVRLLSFINEGDSVKVKMAFRVKTELNEKKKEKQLAATQQTPQSGTINRVSTKEGGQNNVQTCIKTDGRYCDNGNGTISDKNTGLLWQQRDDRKQRSWDDANNYCRGLTLAGANDWRLPSLKEFETIVDNDSIDKDKDSHEVFYETYFKGKWARYWSSTTNKNDTTGAWWNVGFGNGYSDFYVKTDTNNVRCVHGYTAQKVALESEKAAADADAFRLSNLTVLDTRTGLMWVRDGSIAGNDGMNLKAAMKYLRNMNYAGYRDWRLPTIMELETLSKYGGDRPARYFKQIGFYSVREDWYWSSTVGEEDTTGVWSVNMTNGNAEFIDGATGFYFLPVRGSR